jgi:hypothetical protein
MHPEWSKIRNAIVALLTLFIVLMIYFSLVDAACVFDFGGQPADSLP